MQNNESDTGYIKYERGRSDINLIDRNEIYYKKKKELWIRYKEVIGGELTGFYSFLSVGIYVPIMKYKNLKNGKTTQFYETESRADVSDKGDELCEWESILKGDWILALFYFYSFMHYFKKI